MKARRLYLGQSLCSYGLDFWNDMVRLMLRDGGFQRSAIEHGLLGDALPVKAAYLLAAFRYEKPQAGRLREFHQFGVEMLGSPAAASDAEVISMVFHMFRELGMTGFVPVTDEDYRDIRQLYP